MCPFIRTTYSIFSLCIISIKVSLSSKTFTVTEIIDFHKNKSRPRKLREDRKIGSDFRNSAHFLCKLFLIPLFNHIQMYSSCLPRQNEV